MAGDICGELEGAGRIVKLGLESMQDEGAPEHHLLVAADGEFFQPFWQWAPRGADGEVLDWLAVIAMMLSDGSLWVFHIPPILVHLELGNKAPLTQACVASCMERVSLHTSMLPRSLQLTTRMQLA